MLAIHSINCIERKIFRDETSIHYRSVCEQPIPQTIHSRAKACNVGSHDQDSFPLCMHADSYREITSVVYLTSLNRPDLVQIRLPWCCMDIAQQQPAMGVHVFCIGTNL